MNTLGKASSVEESQINAIVPEILLGVIILK
jgi:hypothetical protein